ncbi:AAA family ATPase [Candidatus Uabimicrobium sp. HlEnr_7]|uniref:AAA family ATPase n=1 Tax=Candidatus Uabimicrobium helgolandensis TaxID=3095367 RepID=UPI0035563DFF
MFRFKSLELMNWDCYPNYRVPMDGDIILLIGQNGSGKTTFLDALRVLLNGPRLSKSRTLHHYVRKDVETAMIRGVVTNTLVGERRTFSHLGIYGDVDVSLICIIRNKGNRKIEKEYFIVKGDPPIEKIKDFKSGMRPLQYSKQLEDAGVSRSTLQLIALEQGQTDRIGQLSANQLLQLVMDITGNKDIIKRYEDARQNYRRASQQLIELKTEYNKIHMQTAELEKQANEAEQYKEYIDEKKMIETEKLPISKWYHILDNLHKLERNYSEKQEIKLVSEKQCKSIREEQEKLKTTRELIQKDQNGLRTTQQGHEKQLNALHQKIGKCHSEWQRLEELRKASENMNIKESPQELKDKQEEVQLSYFQNKNALSEVEKKLSNLRKELASLEESPLPTYPDEIYNFRDILDEANIDHLLFAECIEILEPKWQLAIEAFLGRERFSVFVDEHDFLAAKKIGERNRYAFYISPYGRTDIPTQIRTNSILAQLQIADDRIAERLVPLKDILLVDTVQDGHKHKKHITITQSGYRQDKRGGIFIAHKIRFYCGGLAVEQQIQEVEETIEREKQKIPNLQVKLTLASDQKRKIEEKLKIIRRKEEWLSSKDKHEEVKKEGDKYLAESEQINEVRKKILKEIDLLNEKVNQNFASYQQAEKDFSRVQRDQKALQEEMHNVEQKILQLRWQKEELEKEIPSDIRTGYTREDVEDRDWLEHKIKEIFKKLENYSGCRELEKILLFDHETKELKKKKLQLVRQENDYMHRSDELEKCREDYREMIIHTIDFYNKSVKHLASLAGCKMRVFLEMGNAESLIEDSRMEVRVAFDQKREVNIRDKSLSGGQDVIASLILLVALSRMEQDQASGFFIMDEHNAHLDTVRIVEVGRFLRSTKAQFVLTTPTTENVSALSVADLILSFTKKSNKSPHAPKPRFIRRLN